jgi:hypothetical protein
LERTQKPALCGFFAFPTQIEVAMTKTTQPPKESVREYFDRRMHSEEPPPTLEEIRRELGWWLIAENRQQDAGSEDQD